MAVSFDVGSSGGTAAAVTTLTVAHTVAANANSVLFVVGGRGEKADDSAITLTCTYNGVSMTSVPSSKTHANAGIVGFVEVFYIVLGTGDNTAHNIVLTTNSVLDGVFDDMTLIGASYYGVDQANPIGGTTTATGNSGSPAVTRASSTPNMLLFGFGCGSNFTANGQTLIATVNQNQLTGCGTIQADRAAGAASVTCTETSGADSWAAVGIDIAAAAAATTGGQPSTFAGPGAVGPYARIQVTGIDPQVVPASYFPPWPPPNTTLWGM